MVIKYPMLHDKAWLKRQLEDEGKSYNLIAKEIGASHPVVRSAAKKFGLKSVHPPMGLFKHGLGGTSLPKRNDISYYEKNAKCYLKKARIMLESNKIVDPHCEVIEDDSDKKDHE